MRRYSVSWHTWGDAFGLCPAVPIHSALLCQPVLFEWPIERVKCTSGLGGIRKNEPKSQSDFRGLVLNLRYEGMKLYPGKGKSGRHEPRTWLPLVKLANPFLNENHLAHAWLSPFWIKWHFFASESGDILQYFIHIWYFVCLKWQSSCNLLWIL
jgi:hypothetical protein